MVSFERAELHHVEDITNRLRTVDREELTHSRGGDILDTLKQAVEQSEVALVGLKNGIPEALFGIVRVPDAGVIWMVGTDVVYGHGMMLYKIGKAWSHSMLPYYGCLLNYVHLKNTTTLNWLERLGYERGDIIEEYGEGTEPFIRMTLKKEHNNV